MLCSCLFQHPAHYRALLSDTIQLRAIFPELDAIRNTVWVPNQEGVFSLLMMHQLLLYAAIEITVSSR